MPRCSENARELGEPLAGTAPVAAAWVALEQSGPWGRNALLESHLDPRLGARLVELSAALPVTVVLVRRVGEHADHHRAGDKRALWIAWSGGADGSGSWLRHAEVEDPWVVADLDLEALARGRTPGLGQPDSDERLLLVCTNGRRDVCCAINGRAAAVELAGRHPGRVWESSHLGGHRLSPTVLSLPDGFVYGGPGATALDLAACRGRSGLDRPPQAAELAVLAATGATAPRALPVRPGGVGQWLVGSSREERRVDVHDRTLEPARPESCGKDPVWLTAAVAGTIIP